MGLTEKMEGWLFLIRSNRLGLQYSRKRYFVLNEHFLRSFKTIPLSDQQEPGRSAIIDSCIRVTDNGRETVHRKVLFIFTIYNTSNHNDQLKLGATSPEEAAKWIRSLQDAALKECQNPDMDFVACSKRKYSSLRLRGSKRRARQYSIDWTFSPIVHVDEMTSDVIAPSPWKIFGCQNGLRLFKEAKDGDSSGRHWDDHPAIMAVGIVDGTSEAIFRTLMSLGSSRSEWDFCFFRGSVVEHLDGHTDIIHKLLYSDWLPWGMRRRDLLVRRYWRREDDGTYVILYHSVFHKKCLPQKGYVRACLKSGGFVITPVKGKQSLVRHMLAIDWKYWKLYLRPSSARSITIQMLERLAALRELFKSKAGDLKSESAGMNSIGFLPLSVKEDVENEALEEAKPSEDEAGDGVERPASGRKSLTDMNDAADEFFDVAEPAEFGQLENEWSSDLTTGQKSSIQTTSHPKFSSAAVFVKKLQDLRVQKKGYTDLYEVPREDGISCFYGTSLPKDPTFALPCSWASGDPSSFLIRGSNYLQDHQKMTAKGSLMQLVGVDWLKSNKREDDLGGRAASIVQKYGDLGGSEFFFIVNIQIPGGSTMYTLAMYYMTKSPLELNPLLLSFVNGDDAFRNSRFKLIPYISKGSWIVKQSVGRKACLVGQALEINYFRGKNYLEVEIDVGSSTVARGVVSLVLGYLTNLVIEMAFLIQANTEEELPEVLLGTCRLNHLDASKCPHAKS